MRHNADKHSCYIYFSAFSVKKKPNACKPGTVSSVFESAEEENECSSPKKGNNELLETNPQNSQLAHGFGHMV